MRRAVAMLRRLRRWQDGSTAAEFAIAIPVVALFMLGVIEFGRLLWHRSTLAHAVEETGRYAMAHTDAAQSQLTSVLQASAAVALPASAITVSYATAASGGINYLTITATHSFTFMTGLIPLGPITLQSSARVPLLG
jgi:Flp pilus assembly protein TadG